MGGAKNRRQMQIGSSADGTRVTVSIDTPTEIQLCEHCPFPSCIDCIGKHIMPGKKEAHDGN